MKIIVLTGGTLGGKTTIIQALIKKYKNRIITIPEVSSLLFKNEFKRPKRWTLKWHYLLQQAILDKQRYLEDKAIVKAKKENIDLIICDRGMLDPAAYLKNGLSELTQKFNVNEKEMLLRYDKVIHLVSLSVLNKGLYNKFSSSNPYRVENVNEAKKQEEGTLKAWKNHSNRVILSGSMDSNFKNVLKIINKYYYQ
jgi:predicted ATPase